MMKFKRPSEPQFDENYILLRNLNEGDVYLTKANYVGMYLKNLGDDDKHLVKSIDTGDEYVVPHGRYPVFKLIKEDN